MTTPAEASASIPLSSATVAGTQINFLPLETGRLVLRAFTLEDAVSLHSLINDWRVCRTLAGVAYPYGRDQADAWIDETATQLRSGTGCHVAIAGTEVGRETLVGGVGIRLDRAVREGRLGYWVGWQFWGHGVATEAAGRLARWAMANLEIDRLTATVAIDNPRSIAVLRRIGFRPNGEAMLDFIGRGEQRVVGFTASRDDIFGHAEATALAPLPAGAKPLLLVAACALIDVDGRVLLARRPEGKKMSGLWEFPGGKLAAGETPESALIRELKEELGIDVTTSCLAAFAFASHDYERFHLLMPLYLCRRWRGTPTSVEGQTLAWVRPDKLADYPMPPADKPLIPLLRDFL
ncbi:MAG: GNAT family N-acetyltransferase [Acetobacteraceae bacterium]|nr:GNAT family N-acetyltransferase [Acetobacteraceae bacterium]